ncbi:MAG: hypothetical protein QOI73_2449 [Solirubrobacteraceae bacterium]|jgi:hypothetical protein|nr:hypothetical protein [Solirubrobacteraceae bacterium]
MKGKLTTTARIPALTLVAVLAAVGVGYAAIPGADGQIKGCYATSNGLLLGIPHSKGDTRIVDSDEACRAYEKTIAWNQEGTPGAPGTNGTNGSNGTNGVSGYEYVLGTGVGRKTVYCPVGKVAVGGGATVLGLINGANALSSSSHARDLVGGVARDGWEASAVDQTRNVQAEAICITAG